jgi:hypothetical protein
MISLFGKWQIEISKKQKKNKKKQNKKKNSLQMK